MMKRRKFADKIELIVRKCEFHCVSVDQFMFRHAIQVAHSAQFG